MITELNQLVKPDVFVHGFGHPVRIETFYTGTYLTDPNYFISINPRPYFVTPYDDYVGCIPAPSSLTLLACLIFCLRGKKRAYI